MWPRFDCAAFGVVAQGRLQHRDRFGMIAVVVVAKTDLNAEITDRLIVEFGARFRRFIHCNCRQRIAIVPCFSSAVESAQRARASTEGLLRALEISKASRSLASVERP